MSTEYPKIKTLFVRDEATHKVHVGELRNPIYGLIKEWEWTEKIDGTNIRIIWDGAKITFGGRTESAQIPAKLLNWLNAQIHAEALYTTFGDTPAVVFGEGYGAGIQKGGNYSPEQRLIVFDVLVEGRWWLDRENTADVAGKLGLKIVPYWGTASLEDAVEAVRAGFASPLALDTIGEEVYAEGLVGRTAQPLFDKHGDRLIVKIKTRDF